MNLMVEYESIKDYSDRFGVAKHFRGQKLYSESLRSKKNIFIIILKDYVKDDSKSYEILM